MTPGLDSLDYSPQGKEEPKSSVRCSSVQFSGQEITAERGSSEGDIPTTDGHGQARNRRIDSPHRLTPLYRISRRGILPRVGGGSWFWV